MTIFSKSHIDTPESLSSPPCAPLNTVLHARLGGTRENRVGVMFRWWAGQPDSAASQGGLGGKALSCGSSGRSPAQPGGQGSFGVVTLPGSPDLGFKSDPGEGLQGQLHLPVSSAPSGSRPRVLQRDPPTLWRHHHTSCRHEVFPFHKCCHSPQIPIT